MIKALKTAVLLMLLSYVKPLIKGLYRLIYKNSRGFLTFSLIVFKRLYNINPSSSLLRASKTLLYTQSCAHDFNLCRLLILLGRMSVNKAQPNKPSRLALYGF